MFVNSLKMSKIDRKMSELWQILCKNVILTVLCFYTGFIDVHKLPEDEKDRSKNVGVVANSV